MAFQIGNKLSSGRPKNSQNKSSKLIRENLALIIENQMDTIESDLKRLSPEIRLRSITALMKFVLPVLKEVTSETNDNFTPINLDFLDMIKGFDTTTSIDAT